MPMSNFSCGRNTFFFSEVAIAQLFSICQYPKSTSIWISVSSTLWYQELIVNSLVKIISSTRRLFSVDMLERWPHVQTCRVNITFIELPTNCFVSTTKNSMKCVVNWIPLRIRVRSTNTQPHLKEKQALWCLLVCAAGSHFLRYHVQNLQGWTVCMCAVWCMMMMIAFIALKCSWVHLIEGLVCRPNPCRFEFSVQRLHHGLLPMRLSSGRKNKIQQKSS